jgi:hypothetical protein
MGGFQRGSGRALGCGAKFGDRRDGVSGEERQRHFFFVERRFGRDRYAVRRFGKVAFG